MGKRGPKPTPTPLLKLRGSWRGTARDSSAEPASGAVECPLWLQERAGEHWREVHDMLLGWGVMAKPYRTALALMVDAMADWVAVAKEAVGKPWVISNERGETENPIHKVKDRKWGKVLAACREFGMTPSAVTGIKTVEKREASPLDKFKIA